MRRTALIVLLASLLTVGAVGCGGDGDADGDGTAASATTDETTTEGGETTAPDGGADGAAVFASAGCGGCHTLAAADTSGSVGPNLDDLRPDEDAVSAAVRGGPGAMPSFEGDLSDAEITAVAAYVAGSAGS